MTENFVSAHGFARYRVGDQGTVLSDQWRHHPGRIMRQATSVAYPYRTVYLYDGTKGHGVSVHRLVLLSFVGAPADPRMEAAHLNGDISDNRLENLQWVSRRENEAHKKLHGTVAWGERCGRRKLTAKQVIEIRGRLGTQTQRLIAVDFGVSESTISEIRKGTTWGQLP